MVSQFLHVSLTFTFAQRQDELIDLATLMPRHLAPARGHVDSSTEIVVMQNWLWRCLCARHAMVRVCLTQLITSYLQTSQAAQTV